VEVLERKISRTSASLADLYDAALHSDLHIINPGLSAHLEKVRCTLEPESRDSQCHRFCDGDPMQYSQRIVITLNADDYPDVLPAV
jgi:hypothetical protein